MGYDLKPIDAHKRQIVQDLFIDTADDNYIAARWCFVEGLNIDYFWLAVHALEKYMKASLLINRRSGKSYRDNAGTYKFFGHDIVILYEHVKSFASDLLPGRLEQPDETALDYWFDESPEEFLQRLYDYGNPHNRYQIFGFQQFSENIYKLDLMVFALRRLCVPLDGYVQSINGVNLTASGRNLTYRDVLMNDPEEWALFSAGKLKNTASGKRGERLRKILLDNNIPFAPEDFPHSASGTGMEFKNAVLDYLLLKQLGKASDSHAAKIAVELTDWAVHNIKVPEDVEKQLQDAKANCVAKWKI
ncbi:MAG: hypothetical protein OXS28_04510 [Gammaproteobacteria bacterium]|nr:hypothetical protein [Gammaproteobacteria bacterium]